jgi:hypothetical protein
VAFITTNSVNSFAKIPPPEEKAILSSNTDPIIVAFE